MYYILLYRKEKAVNFKEDVKPITYLKNRTAELIKEVSGSKRTIVITQNGVAKAVVMDVGTYDRWRRSLSMLKLLAISEADVESGRTVSQEDALKRAASALEKAGSDG